MAWKTLFDECCGERPSVEVDDNLTIDTIHCPDFVFRVYCSICGNSCSGVGFVDIADCWKLVLEDKKK